MARQVRAFAGLTEDLGSVPCNGMMVHNYLNSSSRGSMPFLAFTNTSHIHGAQTYMKHSHKHVKNILNYFKSH